MSTGGIWFERSVCMFKVMNLEINSRDRMPIQYGVTFMLKSRRNNHKIDGEIEEEEKHHVSSYWFV